MSKITRGLALAGACLAGLATATPASSQTLNLGAVKVTRATAQVPVAVNAPIRVLSPGRNASGASSRTQARRHASNTSVHLPVAVNAPIRILSPGDDSGGAGGPAGDGGGVEPSPGGPSADVPVGVDAPIRIISPGDDGHTGSGEAPAEEGSEGTSPGGDSGRGELGEAAEDAECAEVQAMSAMGGSDRPLFGAMSLLLLALLGTAFIGLQRADRLPIARRLP